MSERPEPPIALSPEGRQAWDRIHAAIAALEKRITAMAGLLNNVRHVTSAATVCYNTTFCAPDCPRCLWEKLKRAQSPEAPMPGEEGAQEV